MVQKTTSQLSQPHSIHRQIMRRVTVVVVVVFALLLTAALALIFSQSPNAAGLDAELTVRESQIIKYLQTPIEEIERIALNELTLAFATGAQGVRSEDGAAMIPATLREAQGQMLQQFLTVNNEYPGQYLSMRYIALATNSVWTEVTVQNGITASNTDFQFGAYAQSPAILDPRSRGSAVFLDTLRSQTTSRGIIQPVLRLYAPVRNPAVFNATLGLIEFELRAQPLINLINDAGIRFGEETTTRRWLLVNNQEQYLADSSQTDIFVQSVQANSFPTLAMNDSAIADVLSPSAPVENVQADNKIISSRQITLGNAPDMPWTLVVVADRNTIPAIRALLVIATVMACTAGAAGTIWFTNRTLRQRLQPLETVSSLAVKLATGNIYDTLLPMKGGNSLSELVEAFERISLRMQDLTEEIQSQDQQITQKLELAAEISQKAAALPDTDLLLQEMVDLICSQLGYYHAQVFLLDNVNLQAILRHSHGVIGEHLLRERYTVPVDASTFVGQVVNSGQAVVLNYKDEILATHALPPHLNKTRTQIVVPIHTGDAILGVLDIHSVELTAKRRDVYTLQMLADQSAVMIKTARELATTQEKLERSERLNRQYTQHAWADTREKHALKDIYTYDLQDVHVTQRESDTTASMSLPISVRGEVIGTIDAAPPTGQPFTEGDTFLLRAVADRVAMVIENARLFNETQSNLNLTQQLYDLSSSLSKADNLEAIIQAVLESVVQDASSGQIWHFDEETDDNSRWLELKALWSKNTTEVARHRELLKLRLPLSASPFLQTLQGDRVKLVSDTEQDFRMDNHLKGLLRLLGVRAVAVVPYTTRGNWRGVLMIGFPHIREFPPQESRIYAALIDQAGIMIDNRMLSEDQERLLDEAQRLYAGSRNISSAQSSMDLIRAVVPVARDSRTNFQLALLEGALDDTGWPTAQRIVASSEGAQITEKNEVHPLLVAPESPLRNREAEIQFRDEGSPRFQAIFPLFSANQPIALFTITNDFVRDLDSQDYEIFLSLTGQMSTVIENRRLLERTTRALDETQQLYKATQAIIGAADINGVYQMAAQYIVAWASETSRITILQAGPMPSLDAAYLDYVYVWDRHKQRGSFQPGMRVSTEATLLTTLFQDSRDARYIGDIETTFASEQRLRLALQQGGANSLIAASVQSGQKWFGMLICEALEANAFNERIKPFIQAVADQVGIAVENRQLFEEARLEAQRALALAEVGQLATRIGADFEQSLTEAFERIAQPTNYDRWLVMLRNETAPDLLEEVISHTAPGYPRWEGLMIDLATAEHSLADAVRFNQSIIVNDPSKYLAFLGLTPEEMRAWGKHIVTPIHIGKRDAGVILVGRSLDSVDIGQHDEQLLVTLAAQVAVAVENRRLFQEAANEREYLGSILQTMPTGVIVLDGRTLKPIRSNQQAELLLGASIVLDQPFNSEIYSLFRLDTYTPYPLAELPVVRARETGKPQFASDLVTFRNNERIDLLLNAAPIHDSRGGITAIVAAFQDISTLRTLEGELQNRLQESQALYEAIRTLANATSLDMVLDAVIAQISQLDVVNGYVILLDKLTGDLDVKRTVYPVGGFDLPFELLERTPRFIPNVNETDALDADTKDLLREQGVHSVSSLPLWSRETLLGWVVLSHDRLPRIADYENLLTAIGDNAATAVDNHLLFLDTQESYLEAASLYEISRTLARAITPQDVVSAVVNHMHRDHIHRILMMEVVSNDINQHVGSVRVAVNWQQHEIAEINMLDVSLSPEQFPNWRHVAASSIVTIDDVSQSLDLNDIERASFLSLDIASLAVLPLYAAQQPLGVLWLVSSVPYRHTERDLRLYGAFTEQAALSLGSVQLLRQTERRARQLALSAEVTQAASSILALDDLLPSVVDQIKEAFRFDHVQIFLMDEDHNYAVLRASTGEAGKKLLSLGHKLQKGSISVIGQVTARGEPVLALDTSDARYQHKPNPHLPHTRSEMALPLITENKVVGALDVQSNRPNAFTDEDVTVLRLLAAQISVAIYNARLFAQAEGRAKNLSFLFDVTASAARPDDTLHESLQEVASQVRDLLKTRIAAVYLLEEYVDLEENRFTMLEPAALAGSDQPLSEMSEIPLDDPGNLVSQTARLAQVRVIPRVSDEPSYLPIISSTRSAIIVPMLSGNILTGLLILEDETANAYQEETLTLLGALTNNLAAIIQSTRLLERIQQQNEQLMELDRLRSDFLANMSHELRTPLNSIIGFSRVILKGIDGPLTEMQEQDISTIYNSGQHLLGLINDILDQAKIAAGKMDLHIDYFDVKPLAEGVRSIGIGLVKDKPIDLVLNVSPSLPKAYGDEFRTRQVLLNLVSNASKFTQEGQIVISVYSQPHPTSGVEMVRVDVADTGIGIAQKDLPLLFEAFRQVDSSLTRTVGGTGLGLPIAKSLIEMQGGMMLVESQETIGSTFSILIPTEAVPEEELKAAKQKSTEALNPSTANQEVRRATQTTRRTRPAAQSGATGQIPAAPENGNRETMEVMRAKQKRITSTMAGVMQPKRQILIAEENPAMIDQYRRALQREGYEIFAAGSPLEAEAMVSGLHPTLIIMDANFSKGACWDILTHLKERDDTQDIPVLIASLSDDTDRAFAAGAFGFIRRPFTPDQLVKTVAQAEREGQTERILIIDDQPDSTRLLKQILDAQGRYRVYTAHSGNEGVSQVARRRPDLILLDLRMPEMDGFAVLEELRAHPETATIPIVIITGESLNKDEQERLADVEVLYKTDISAENHEAFLEEVKTYLTGLYGV